MNKNIIYVLVGVVIIIAGYSLLTRNAGKNEVVNNSSVVTSSTTPSYTLAQVSIHGSQTDCWTAVNGYVYDVTSFIPSHPGGKEIIKACGKDGTSLFKSEDEHVEQNAQGTLDAFFIGKLSN